VHEYVNCTRCSRAPTWKLAIPTAISTIAWWSNRRLLAAPSSRARPELVQPKVLYLYADPASRTLGGQKSSDAPGRRQRAKVKAKLREIRPRTDRASSQGR